jgi:hypothetical protein
MVWFVKVSKTLTHRRLGAFGRLLIFLFEFEYVMRDSRALRILRLRSDNTPILKCASSKMLVHLIRERSSLYFQNLYVSHIYP